MGHTEDVLQEERATGFQVPLISLFLLLLLLSIDLYWSITLDGKEIAEDHDNDSPQKQQYVFV